LDTPKAQSTAELAREFGTSKAIAYLALVGHDQVVFIACNQRRLIEKMDWQDLLESSAAESEFYKTYSATQHICPRDWERFKTELGSVEKSRPAATVTIAAAACLSSNNVSKTLRDTTDHESYPMSHGKC
jgi:hypothetical protein